MHNAAYRTVDDPYLAIEPFTNFDRIVDTDVYRGLPDDWVVGISDVVGSTKAIEAGRYKAVNMAGAAMISAVKNALAGREFPFVFGGDGAEIAVSGADAALLETVLASTARWVADDLGLELRVAMVPVSTIRAAGHDVRVARYAPSGAVSYAMFSGGGVGWAERQAKAGAFKIAPAPAGSRPDLTGLSCRWEPIESRNGTILSLIVQPSAMVTAAEFASLIQRLLQLLDDARGGHPVPEDGPARVKFPPSGIEFEALAARGKDSVQRQLRRLRWASLFAWVIFKTGMRVGKFDPHHYKRQVAQNTDFRKFDDGLRMTIDCSQATAEKLDALLSQAQEAGHCSYGTHRQSAALMTCIVPSVTSDDHIHFLDGAGGGYAQAAQVIKHRAD